MVSYTGRDTYVLRLFSPVSVKCDAVRVCASPYILSVAAHKIVQVAPSLKNLNVLIEKLNLTKIKQKLVEYQTKMGISRVYKG